MRAGAKDRQRTQAKGSGKGSRRRAPRSFEEALTQGWTIHEQLASWQFKGGNQREGFFFLRKKGPGESRTLMVRHTALYQLGRPYFL
jgi:hypothetical protein